VVVSELGNGRARPGHVRIVESKIVEGHPMSDHVQMCIGIPPNDAVAHVVGYITGKSAIHIPRKFAGRQRNFTGENFRARGDFISTSNSRRRIFTLWKP
jgi:REP element-mobilizing transposase RayT